MTEQSKSNGLLPAMRLAADKLSHEEAQEQEATRDRLAAEFKTALENRQLEGMAPLARQLADIELSLGMKDEALASYRRAASLLAEGGADGDAAVLAATHYAVAELSRDKGRFSDAEGSYIEAERAFASTGDAGARATCLLCAGWMRARTKRNADALEAYEQAIDLFRECNDDLGKAHALFRSAAAMAQVDESAAVTQLAEAREIFTRIDHEKELNPEGRVANTPLPNPKGDLRSAEPWLMAKLCAQGVATDEAPSTPSAARAKPTLMGADRRVMIAAMVFGGLVVTFALAFRPGEEPMPVRASVANAAPKKPQVSVAARRAAALLQRASDTAAAGDPGAARADYEVALDIFRRLGDSQGQADSLMPLAELASGEDARSMFEEARSLYAESGDIAGQTKAVSAITAADEESGNIEGLLENYAKQADLYEVSADTTAQAKAIARLADLHWEQGSLEPARQALLRLLPIQERLNYTPAIAGTLERIAALEMSTSVQHSTRAKLERAYALYREDRSVEGQGRTLIALGDLEMMGEKPRQARAAYKQALTLVGDHPEPETRRRAMLKLAESESALGQTDRAAKLFQQALQTCAADVDDPCRSDILSRLGEVEKENERL